jgi:hypothetical protein
LDEIRKIINASIKIEYKIDVVEAAAPRVLNIPPRFSGVT